MCVSNWLCSDFFELWCMRSRSIFISSVVGGCVNDGMTSSTSHGFINGANVHRTSRLGTTNILGNDEASVFREVVVARLT